MFLKTIVSRTGEHRAVISRRPDGLVHVGFERWDDTAVGSTGGYNDPFWRPDGPGLVVTTPKEAEALAEERLGNTALEG